VSSSLAAPAVVIALAAAAATNPGGSRITGMHDGRLLPVHAQLGVDRRCSYRLACPLAVLVCLLVGGIGKSQQAAKQEGPIFVQKERA